MRYEIAADCAADVTRIITHNLELEKTLSRTALTLFRALHEVAVEVAAARGHVPTVSQVSYFAPVEAVALALGCHRSTVYRAASELVDAGLVDHRGHFTTLRGRTRSDGSVWAIRLQPVGGCRARLGYGDLKRQYRDLGADVDAGQTVWSTMRQSKLQSRKAGVDLSYIRRWSLSPTHPTPLRSDCRTGSRRSLEAVLDVRHVDRSERSRVVDLAAQALATALRDHGAVNFYRALCWRLLRRLDATGEDHFHVVFQQAQRAAGEVREGYGRRPGALLVSRLKRAPWWSETWTGPPVEA